MYYGARWYDPEIGRFMAVDPVGFDPQNVQSFNRYAYANNNPYKFVDPDGRSPFAVPVIPGAFAPPGSMQPGQIDTSQVPSAGEIGDRVKSNVALTALVLSLPSELLTHWVMNEASERDSENDSKITKSSKKRLKKLIKGLSDDSRQDDGLSQEKKDQLERLVKKAGAKLRNDGDSGVKGSSAGKPHVQTEGLGGIDRRHIWTQKGVE